MAVSDEALVGVLSRFVSLTSSALRDPQRWLGWGATSPAAPRGRLAGLTDRLLADAPGSEQWVERLPDERAEWWVNHISNLAGFLAATPRLMGAAADRLPLQAALGTAVAGLAVCAVALERGVDDPRDWVPLLGRVLFDRDLPRGTAVGVSLDETPATDVVAEPDEEDAGPAAPPRQTRQTAVQLARTLLALRSLFEDRPRGARIFRALGKVPVVGLVGGWLDERGAVRTAAIATERALLRN